MSPEMKKIYNGKESEITFNPEKSDIKRGTFNLVSFCRRRKELDYFLKSIYQY